ncbi:methyltransferase domain-containing protein, partial [Chloroflexi bacterium]|nr:methyltransferase domain-containing protein [Chloroflexota bacterium]
MGNINNQPFQEGDMVVLYDRRSREYMAQLNISDQFESHLGNLKHSEIIGKPEGSWVPTSTGHLLLVFKPSRFQYTLNMPRVATIVYPKDLGSIITYSNICAGSRVLEAGSGSGSLTITLSEIVGKNGHVYSYDIRKDMLTTAESNLKKYNPGCANVTFKVADVSSKILEQNIDAVILDLPEPWEAVDSVAGSLRSGATFLSFLPNISQVSDLVEKI